MSEKTPVTLRDHAQDILYTGTLGERAYAGLDEDGLSEAFLYMIRREGITPVMLDNIRYKNTPHKLDYLSSVYRVSSLYFELEEKWYKKDKGAFIGFLKEDGRAIPIERKGHGYRYRDIQAGRYVKITEKNVETLKNQGIFLYCLPRENEKNNFLLLMKEFWRQRNELWIFFLLTIFTSILTSVVPSVTQEITNYYIPARSRNLILQTSITLIFTIVTSFCLNVLINFTRARFQTKAGARYFSGLLAKIMEMSPGEEKQLSGRMISLIMSFLAAVDTILSSIPGLLIYMTQVSIILLVINGYDSNFRNSMREVMLLGTVFVIVSLYLIYKYTKSLQKAQSRLNVFRRESVDHVDVLKNYNREDRSFLNFSIVYSDYSNQKNKILNVRRMLSIFFSMISGIGMLIICIKSYRQGYLDQGTFSAILSSFTLWMGYMNSLANTAADLVQSSCELQLGQDILNTTSENISASGVSRKISGKIEMRNVFFSYSPEGNPVISDVNLIIQPGEYIGIAGASGSGKSTLMRLLMGFEMPSEGDIYYDDINMTQYNLKDLRRQFGVVMQNDSVYNGSILMNIGMSNNADIDQVKKAADAAAILDEIEAMPMKFNTILSSEADVVSGGQKQRIVLARALMHTPKILFLDEASSAMDNVTQDKVKKKMDELGITRISIAHRLSTIRNCDRILVMDRGKIVEVGTYDELMAKQGLFYHMARRNLT